MKKPWHIRPTLDEQGRFNSFRLVGIGLRKFKKRVRTWARKAGVEVSFTYAKETA